MQTQSYQLRDVADLPSADEKTDEVEQRQLLLASLGFEAQFDWESNSGPALEMARLLYPELTGHELETWRRFLPTRERFKDYNFDTVPDEALAALETAQRLDCFSKIQIWTPAGNDFHAGVSRAFDSAVQKADEAMARLDPMAVGVATDIDGSKRYFQIVRWGEALLPLDQIERYTNLVQRQLRTTFLFVPFILFALIVAMITSAITHFGTLRTFVGLVGVVAALMVCTAFQMARWRAQAAPS